MECGDKSKKIPTYLLYQGGMGSHNRNIIEELPDLTQWLEMMPDYLKLWQVALPLKECQQLLSQYQGEYPLADQNTTTSMSFGSTFGSDRKSLSILHEPYDIVTKPQGFCLLVLPNIPVLNDDTMASSTKSMVI